MCCPKCGKDLQDDANYCTKCGPSTLRTRKLIEAPTLVQGALDSMEKVTLGKKSAFLWFGWSLMISLMTMSAVVKSDGAESYENWVPKSNYDRATMERLIDTMSRDNPGYARNFMATYVQAGQVIGSYRRCKIKEQGYFFETFVRQTKSTQKFAEDFMAYGYNYPTVEYPCNELNSIRDTITLNLTALQVIMAEP